MKIKEITIQNYRKIHNALIDMEDNITIIAGANNSGKTSLVELFNAIFGEKKGKLCGNDIPVIEYKKWGYKVYPIFYQGFLDKMPKNKFFEYIDSNILVSGNEKLILPLTVKIQVDYDKDKDDIRYFADYIMELDPDNTSFYFVYKYELNKSSFRESLDTYYEKLLSRLQKITGDETKDKDIIRSIKEILTTSYSNACEEKVYFCDKDYSNVVQLEITEFKRLFNYRHIMAGRTLDDENSDRSHILSKNMIDIASGEEDWKDFIGNLPEEILLPIQDAKIKEKVRKASIESLSDAIDAIAKTNGGQTGNIVIDMDITDESIKSFFKSITCAKYQTDDCYLSESSQGLGYSNLIYIHLQLEKFRKTINKYIVNFFIIEEPEAHMHPQMQNVFTKYLLKYYKNIGDIQGIITTHSHEVVRNANISQLRVLRQLSAFECKIYDLKKFCKNIEDNKGQLEFYDLLYTINFPDIIFADKIILYEGDTERMLIKDVLKKDKEYEDLSNQYLSFVQVGGAYAYNYRDIIDFLEIKAVLITDIDYNKVAKTKETILSSTTTNETIKKFAMEMVSIEQVTVEDLYKWKDDSSSIVINTIYLAFQGKNDGMARTLEEAMLAKYYNVSVIEQKQKEDWKELRKNDKLKYTIPKDGDEFNIRDIVAHTSDKKTDFMYSVILNSLSKQMLPSYIAEALKWLAK